MEPLPSPKFQVQSQPGQKFGTSPRYSVLIITLLIVVKTIYLPPFNSKSMVCHFFLRRSHVFLSQLQSLFPDGIITGSDFFTSDPNLLFCILMSLKSLISRVWQRSDMVPSNQRTEHHTYSQMSKIPVNLGGFGLSRTRRVLWSDLLTERENFKVRVINACFSRVISILDCQKISFKGQ